MCLHRNLFPQTWQLTSTSCLQKHFQPSSLNLHQRFGDAITPPMSTCPCLVTIKTLTFIAQAKRVLYTHFCFLLISHSIFPVLPGDVNETVCLKVSLPILGPAIPTQLITTIGVTMFFHDLYQDTSSWLRHSTSSKMSKSSHSLTFLPTDLKEE